MTATDDLLAWVDHLHDSAEMVPAVLPIGLAAALRITENQRDTAYAVIRQLTEGDDVTPDWDPTEYGWTPAEAEAIANATRSEP